MKINVQRLPDYYIWKVMFPLCLIVVMSWIPRWLDPREFGTGIGISTTAFLTLVAYLFAVMGLLPRISYLTRMDVFILLSMALVFIALLQTSIGAYFAKRHRLEWVESTNRLSRIIYPVLLLGVLVISLF